MGTTQKQALGVDAQDAQQAAQLQDRVAITLGCSSWGHLMLRVDAGERVLVSSEGLHEAGPHWQRLRLAHGLVQVRNQRLWQIGRVATFSAVEIEPDLAVDHMPAGYADYLRPKSCERARRSREKRQQAFINRPGAPGPNWQLVVKGVICACLLGLAAALLTKAGHSRLVWVVPVLVPVLVAAGLLPLVLHGLRVASRGQAGPERAPRWSWQRLRRELTKSAGQAAMDATR
jgi:hypothetical protein